MAHIPLFHNPFGFPMQQVQQVQHQFVQIPMPPPLNLQLFGGIPMAVSVSVQKTVQAVGCIIMTKSSKNSSQYDLLMCHSERNAYEVFGGDIQYGSNPRECMNSLLGYIGLHAAHSTPYIDIENHMNGKLYRIYILYMPHTSCTHLTQSIQTNRILSGAFHHFIRIPIMNILSNSQTIRDDKGIYREFTSFSRNISLKIAQRYRDFI
jgi:hypothetical protein